MTTHMNLRNVGMIADLEHYATEENAAQKMGRDAYLEGIPVTANPFMRGSLQWENWRLGWNRAPW